jgi:hypothetical protein
MANFVGELKANTENTCLYPIKRTIRDTSHHLDLKIIHRIIKPTSAKNINGKPRPKIAMNHRISVLTKGSRQVKR